MKKLILLLFMIIWTSAVFAQTGEVYERSVGTQHGKYPLTVTGLRSAIASLDTGVVYVAYPGILDTAGVGAIPSTVKVHGWLFGDIVVFNESVFQNMILNTDISRGAIFRNTYSGSAPISGHKVGLWSISGLEREGGYTLAAWQVISAADFELKMISADTVTNVYGTRNTFALGSYSDFLITNYYGHTNFWWAPSGSGAITNWYSYYSSLDNIPGALTITNGYHFYGAGDYPSYFGGDVEAAGTLKATEEMLIQHPVNDVDLSALKMIRIDIDHFSYLINWGAQTHTDSLWVQPAKSKIISIVIRLDEQWVGSSIDGMQISIGYTGDPDGLIIDSGNQVSDAVGTEYEELGIDYDTFTEGLHGRCTADVQINIRATVSSGAGILSNMTDGNISVYILYESPNIAPY